MAQKKRAKTPPRKPARVRKSTRRRRAPRGHHHPELIGLALVAVGVFLAALLWFGWDGGVVGGWVSRTTQRATGAAAYVLPAMLVAVGLLMVGKSRLVDVRPFRIGGVVLAAGLVLVLGRAHGGWAGSGAHWAVGSVIGTTGAVILGAFAIVAGVLLVSGASAGALIRRSGHAARRAGTAARASLDRPRRGESSPAPRRRPAAEPALVPEPFAPHGDVVLEPSQTPVDAVAAFPDVVSSPSTAVSHEPAPLLPDDEDTQERPHLFDDPPTKPGEYRVPSASLLRRSQAREGGSHEANAEVARRLVDALANFGIAATIVGQVSGPRVTRYELQLAPGTKLSKVTALKDDLSYALATTEIRILAPIPGKQAVGVEVPNLSPNMVTLGDIFDEIPSSASPLAVWLGKDISGNAVWADLARMPHILIAGTTGSGKSGCINTILTSILLRSTPDDVRMILVDPKRVELGFYESIPHLLTPVVTNPKAASAALLNVVTEMERRYERLSILRARNLSEANRELKRRGEDPLPYLLVVIDELADLMMTAPQAVEDAIIRLAQKSRAVGIHLVLATQRPSVDVITGMIKANVPSRIAFAVSSATDSRVILDGNGAESLLGQGDMLFKPLGTSRLQRVQGAFVTEEEVALIVEQCRAQREQDLDESLLEPPEPVATGDEDDDHGEFDPDDDPLLDKAIEIVVQTQTASVSLLQRRLRVGYTRAGRLIDMLERRGIISGYEGSKPRQVLVREGDLERLA